MSLLSILVLALGLALDSAAAAAAQGFVAPRLARGDALRLGLLFGSMHALMPLIGFLAGSALDTALLRRWDHWIAFLLLGALGAKALWEGLTQRGEKDVRPAFRLRLLLPLALATSIDALLVGVTLPWMGAPLLLSLTLIASTTFLMSVSAVHIGRHFGKSIGRGFEAIGGLALIAIGIKILAEHLIGGH